MIENVEIGDGIFNLSQTEYENLNLIQKEKELVKPFYTTTELLQYFGNPKNRLWIIYTNSSFKDEQKILPYPNIKNHLDSVITSYSIHYTKLYDHAWQKYHCLGSWWSIWWLPRYGKTCVFGWELDQPYATHFG